MLLHGVEFDFNPLRVADVERYDAANKQLKAANANHEGQDFVEALRAACAAFDEFFKQVLGADYAAKTGIDTGDMEALGKLAVELAAAVNQKKAALAAEFKPPAANAAPVHFEPHGQGKRKRRRR